MAEQVLMQLLSDAIALVVVLLLGKHFQLNTLPLLITPLVFIAPANIDPASDPRHAGELDLAVAQLVVPRSGLSRERLQRWLKSNRVQPNIISEVSGNEALIAMVSLGCGIGVVPQLV